LEGVFHNNAYNRNDFAGKFKNLFGDAVEGFVTQQEPSRGPQPKLSASQLLVSFVYHAMVGTGVFSEHVLKISGVSIKDSSLSERRQRIGVGPFAWLMKHALKPMADPARDPSCFYKGWRLCGIDGTRWSVTNTPQILAKMLKAKSRRLEAAFAKVEMCALVELGTHNPIAAEIGLKRESEWTLASALLNSLPEASLLILDRLYGCGKYLNELVVACQSRCGHVLVRARSNVKSHKIKRLKDGSARVSIRLAGKTGVTKNRLELREIKGRIKKPGDKKWIEVRFWTTLLDEKTYPAMELLKLYGFRWEHEIFYKELKITMSGGELLQSHTPETAAQEVAALLMACSIIAQERLIVSRTGELNPLSISFIKTLAEMNSLWTILAVAHGLLDEVTVELLVERVRESIIRQKTPERRSRNCARKVRQPVSSWPRLIITDSNEGEYEFETIDFP
jgi:Transposase DDE domain